MSYAKNGSLRKYLPNVVKYNWYNKLQLLEKIIFGLKTIHESDLIHCDLHDGNVLISDNSDELFITDLGLCKPINTLQNSSNNDNDDIYGVLPYIAPEILRRKPYTPASDIYSFSMIMWEFTSGVLPFDDKSYLQLGLNICKNKRPDIIENTPQCYVNLMKKCWDSDPFKRPTIQILEDIISDWLKYIKKYYEEVDKRVNPVGKVYSENISNRIINDITIGNNQLRNDIKEFVKADALVNTIESNTIIQSYPQVYHESRPLDFTKQLNEILDIGLHKSGIQDVGNYNNIY